MERFEARVQLCRFGQARVEGENVGMGQEEGALSVAGCAVRSFGVEACERDTIPRGMCREERCVERLPRSGAGRRWRLHSAA